MTTPNQTELIFKKSDRTSEVWKMVSICRQHLKKLEKAVIERRSVKEKLIIKKEVVKNLVELSIKAKSISDQTNDSWPHFFQWLAGLVHKRRAPSGIARYMDAVGNVLDYCYVQYTEFKDLSTDDVAVILRDEEGVIKSSTYKNLKWGLVSFIEYLKTKIPDVPEINWNSLRSKVDASPRVIVITPRFVFEKRIKKLYKSGKEREQDAALVGIMTGIMGMRETEVASFFLEDIRIIDGENDYLIVNRGKGGKMRRIPLFILKHGIKEIWIDAYQRAIPRFRKGYPNYFLSRIKTADGVATLFMDYYGDIAPDGPHVGRHSAGTGLNFSGVKMLDVAEILGHATLRTFQRTYNQGTWIKAKKISIKVPAWEQVPLEYITLKEIQGLTLYAHSGILRKTAGKSNLRKQVASNRNRKGRQAESIYNARNVMESFYLPEKDPLRQMTTMSRIRFLLGMKSDDDEKTSLQKT